MIRRPPRSTQSSSSAASDVYKRQLKGRARPGATAFDSAILTENALELGLECELADEATDALARARELAARRGGMVLIAGSHYLVDAMGL